MRRYPDLWFSDKSRGDRFSAPPPMAIRNAFARGDASRQIPSINAGPGRETLPVDDRLELGRRGPRGTDLIVW